MTEDMSKDETFRKLKQQAEICDDCDKAPLQGCINTWFPSWFLQTEDNPTHPANEQGKVLVARHAKRCPQFSNKPWGDAGKRRERRGFVIVSGAKR